MTGFGAADGRVGSAQVTVELRAVNHRFFNPSIKLPAAYGRWESEVREALRQRVARGHVTLSVRTEREAGDGITIDEVRFAAYVARLRALQRLHGLAGELDVGTVLRLPDVLAARSESVVETDGSAAELVALVIRASDALAAARQEEGARLAIVLRERLEIVEGALTRMAARAPSRLVEQRDRLRQAVIDLTGGIALDEGRVAQEIAVLADRLDVSEELDRFGSHIGAFGVLLRSPDGEPVGKRLGFLLQEMLREANTAGSKAADAAMLQNVMVVKEELERIREQVENLE